jgi:hypothetical protein
MNNIKCQSAGFVLRALGALLLAVSLYPPEAAQARDGMTFFHRGKASALAAHRTGLVLEFHNDPEPASSVIWYRFGTLDGASKHVTWSNIQFAGMYGFHPSVAISYEGYVIVAYSSQAFKLGSHIYYRVGQINPNAGRDQSIHWLTNPIRLDAGSNASIAMNEKDVIVAAYESGVGDNRIYYQRGYLNKPPRGHYEISFFGKGVHVYDIGINPAIAINNRSEVVAVHQAPKESVLYYRRGYAIGNLIQFGESRRYGDHAENPAIALLDNGLLLEVHTLGGLTSRIGRLSLANGQDIEWNEPVKEFAGSFQAPAVAATGAHAVVTFDDGDFYNPKIYYTVGEVPAE